MEPLRGQLLIAGAAVIDPNFAGVFVDLVKFCLKEKGKTAFLLSKDSISEYRMLTTSFSNSWTSS